MKDLSQLATDHSIEGILYNGDALDKILNLIGEGRVTRWLCKICDDDDENEEGENDLERKNKKSWSSLVDFLQKDVKILERKAMVFHNFTNKDSITKKHNYHTDN